MLVCEPHIKLLLTAQGQSTVLGLFFVFLQQERSLLDLKCFTSQLSFPRVFLPFNNTQ